MSRFGGAMYSWSPISGVKDSSKEKPKKSEVETDDEDCCKTCGEFLNGDDGHVCP